MNLDPEHVQATASFFEAYAQTALVELRSLRDRQEEPGIREGRFAMDTEFGFDELSERSATVDDSAFVVAADAATALREAAQWMLYLDPYRAARLLTRSGDLFLQIGYAYGAYLLVAAGRQATTARQTDRTKSDIRSDRTLFRFFGRAIRELTGERESVSPRPEILPNLRFQPQQQVYLLLACAGYDSVRQEFRSVLRRFADTSQHRFGVTSVGSLGTPIRRLWTIARHLIDPDTARNSVDGIADHLAVMSRRFAEVVNLAQTNTYLWTNGASPVDIGDLDIVGITTLTARRFGLRIVQDAVNRLIEREQIEPIGQAPIEAGLTLARVALNE